MMMCDKKDLGGTVKMTVSEARQAGISNLPKAGDDNQERSVVDEKRSVMPVRKRQ